jgi:His/Glu/Gln/Arg/opine family amino acid ABC transporter permease subunit
MGSYQVIKDALPFLLQGAWVTIQVSVIVIVLATMLGTPLAFMRLSPNKFFSMPSALYVWFLRGTPALVILIFVFYALPSVGLKLPAFAAAVLGLTLNASAYKAEIIRSGIMAVPRSQTEAALAIGMSDLKIATRVVLPQAARIVVPPFVNNAILIVKNSALVSVITVPDLMLNATQIYSSTFQAVAIFGTAGLLYLIITSGLALLQRWAERRFAYYSR